MKATVLLFGMPRQVETFVSSFEKNMLTPLASLGFNVDVTGDLNIPSKVNNPRSKEYGSLGDHSLLTELYPNVILTPQNDELVKNQFTYFSEYPDYWQDDYGSLKNLLFQMSSLNRGLHLVTPGQDLYLMLRPDLIYHDDMEGVFKRALKKKAPCLFSPSWQLWGGLNDRFAVTNSYDVLNVYCNRLDFAEAFVALSDMGIHSERLLAYAIGQSGFSTAFFSNKASRHRINGEVVKEDYRKKRRKFLRTLILLKASPKQFAKS